MDKGIMLAIRVPIFNSGTYLVCATLKIIQIYGDIGVQQLNGESPRR